MKILVIDDRQENREAAIHILAGHEVTTVQSYDAALDLIEGKTFDFDIVFIDLMMPASSRTLGNNIEHRYKELMPYGFPLMIATAMHHASRVKNIAIVSDVNHHKHAMSAALDPIGGYHADKYVTINGIHCSFIHANLQMDDSKRWDLALKRVISSENNLG